ncbi:hypothetical protein V499_01117 [Pseudogymnoascus sp. VKM F-103]|nr:hypothetical protein V499_01117 [Pseudogymnoascus sp. VKM F-103]
MVRLVGSPPPRRAVAARPGTLKSEAIEAEMRVERAVKRKRRVIDLGCEIPFTRIPLIVEEGFTALAKVQRRDSGALPRGAELSPGMSRRPALRRAPDN